MVLKGQNKTKNSSFQVKNGLKGSYFGHKWDFEDFLRFLLYSNGSIKDLRMSVSDYYLFGTNRSPIFSSRAKIKMKITHF